MKISDFAKVNIQAYQQLKASKDVPVAILNSDLQDVYTPQKIGTRAFIEKN